mmetsp:Transcript_31578/g.108599  ORF Transcript_31578/g.108599 Transcript_31578/m.108599 type:complete len:81 (-) Transcript_31578:49-291(-)
MGGKDFAGGRGYDRFRGGRGASSSLHGPRDLTAGLIEARAFIEARRFGGVRFGGVRGATATERRRRGARAAPGEHIERGG